MRIICFLLLCLAFLQATKGHTVADETQESHSSSPQDDLLQSCKANEQFCTENNKLLRNHIELLTNSMEEMTINSCGRVYDQVQELLKKENEFQKQLESKNVEIRQLVENMTKLQLENMNYKSKEDSMSAVQEELKKQQVIIEQLAKNQCEKENTEIAQIKAQLSSEGEQLVNCNTELESKRNALAKTDQEITKQQTELRKSADKLEKRNRASCIGQVSSGVHTVTLSNNDTFEVLCNSNLVGPGWTVIQQRIRANVDFNRDWNSYRNGFGDFRTGDFFLGLEKIHRLTAEQPHELNIHMVSIHGCSYNARYDEFAISGEEDKYAITKLGRFFGFTSDQFSFHKGMKFSTFDQDNELNDDNCAKNFEGGWWYNSNCANCVLNAHYYQTKNSYILGVVWEGISAVKHANMMIRPKVQLNCI